MLYTVNMQDIHVTQMGALSLGKKLSGWLGPENSGEWS